MEWVIIAAAYLIGSVPTALLVVWVATGRDVRQSGSRNVGATNTMRAAGLAAGSLVAVIDIAKGVIPVLLMLHFTPASRWLGAAAVAAVIGHCFPVWLGFRGGKGVATGIGAFAPLAPLALLCGGVVWWTVLAAWRRVALASLVMAATFPLLVVYVSRAPRDLVIASSVVALVIIIRHTPNIRRMIAGEEPRIGEERDESGDEE